MQHRYIEEIYPLVVPAHELERSGITCFGIRWETAHANTAQTAFSFITQIKNYPDDVDAIYNAIYFAQKTFSKEIRISTNHFNAETVRDIMRDSENFIRTGTRSYSMDRLALLLEKDDGSSDHQLSNRCYSFKLSPHGFAKWASSVDGVLDMLCVISTLTKLLQK